MVVWRGKYQDERSWEVLVVGLWEVVLEVEVEVVELEEWELSWLERGESDGRVVVGRIWGSG